MAHLVKDAVEQCRIAQCTLRTELSSQKTPAYSSTENSVYGFVERTFDAMPVSEARRHMTAKAMQLLMPAQLRLQGRPSQMRVQQRLRFQLLMLCKYKLTLLLPVLLRQPLRLSQIN